MKFTAVALTLLFAISVRAQESSMPGMQMPATPLPAARPKASKMPKPSDPSRPPRPGSSEPARPPAPASTPEGTEPPTQDMHGGATPTQAPARGSVTHDSMALQEPEDPDHRTGSDLPSPDLLNDVLRRPPLAVEFFLAAADQSNPTLMEASASVKRAAALARQAGLYPNPTVGYQGEQIRGGSYGGGEQGAFVQQTIVLGGKLGLRRSMYQKQVRSDEIGIEEQKFRVHNDVAQAFYTALTAQALVIVRQKLLRVALDGSATVHQLANVGQADAPDILQAEVETEQAKIDFVAAQRTFLRDFHVAAALAGVPELPVSPLLGTLESPPQIDAVGLLAAIVSTSPTVKRMESDVAVSEARLRGAKREAVPDLQIRAGEQFNFEQISNTPARPVGPQSFATAGITIPLWNRNQGNIAASQAEIERARQSVRREQLHLHQAAEPYVQSYESSRFTADRYQHQLIPRAQRAYELYLKKYESMAAAYPQVLVSQRTLFQLQVAYLTSLGEVWKSAVALENFTLSGGLSAPASSDASSTTSNPPGASAGSLE